ncbi:MAG: hypothetical protein EZS28_042283 [Streblomastix strix]|uniref:Uncharacterized protein n=1 Tax=Streblomastix strix TaxID=222440 RepID=A0A5J4TVX8_9EUKA|nr:MAG: hypothetical protein EZS28_042283 [Streblomastix strix]
MSIPKLSPAENKNKMSQNSNHATEENFRVKMEVMKDNEKYKAQEEKNNFLLELEQIKTSNIAEMNDFRKQMDELRASYERELTSHHSTRESFLEQCNRADNLDSALRRSKAERQISDEKAQKAIQESAEMAVLLA